MNLLPTPETSPIVQLGKSGAKKLKNEVSQSEKKVSKKEKKKTLKSSKSLPALNLSLESGKTIKPKSLFPKVALVKPSKKSKALKASKSATPSKSPKALKSPKVAKSPKVSKPPKSQKSPELPNGIKTPKTPKKKKEVLNGFLPNDKQNERGKEVEKVEQKTPKKTKVNGKTTPVKENKKESSHEEESQPKKIKLNGNLTSTEESKDSIVKSEDIKIEWRFGIQLALGQLAWARIGNFPFWPCVVTLEPESKIFCKTQLQGKVSRQYTHVQYFADNERHSWVSELNILPFYGANDFETLAPELVENNITRNKKTDAKFKSGFIVPPTQRPKWEIAVSEATDILGISNEDRAFMFAPAPPIMKISTQSPAKKRKRKRSSGDPDFEVPLKKFKSEVKEEELFQKRNVKSRKSKDSKSNLSSFEKNSKMNKSTGDLSKISGKFGKLNGKFSKSTGNLNKLFEKTPKMNGKLNKDLEKSQRVNGKLSRSLKSCKVETYDGITETPLTPPSSLMSNSWDEDCPLDILMALDQSGIEDVVKKESWSDSMQEIGEDSSIQSTSSPDDDSSEDLKLRSSRKFSKREKKIKEELIEIEKRMSTPINLFKGIRAERVCQICEQTGKLVRCKGPCFSYYHLSCVKPSDSSPEPSEVEDNVEDELFQDLKEIRAKIAEKESLNEKPEVIKIEDIPEEETFKCIDCLSGVAPACFICNDREVDRERCSAAACGKYYHPACLKIWPQSHWHGGRLTCPYHMCHTCTSDNPQNGHVSKTNEKLARCVRCPSAYHPSTFCLPAGSEILTGNQIICPKHYVSNQTPINATWCFLCTKGGSLICCDTCPTSFHPECLGINTPDGAYICEDCETGRLPLYGEIVWVKLGCYRWWPARICFPYEIPPNVEALKHKIGEFCVMFLGTRNYHWVHRGRVFLYQEGDAAKTKTDKKYMDKAFNRALNEASHLHQLLKKKKAFVKDHECVLKPPHYVRIKMNRPVGNVKPVEVESIVACACSPNKESPCAPDTNCLNRILLFECSPDICPAGSKCQNQAFVQRLYPAMEPFHTDGRGWGLRSLEPIKSGQFVIEYVGEVINEAEYKRRLQRKKELKNENYYFLTIDTGRMIDAEPKGNLSRFMNHSCQPNCVTQKWTVNGDTRIGLFALRDINVGEELTFNYNLACDGEKRKPCLCGAPNCSGFIGLKVQKQQISAIQEKKVVKVEKPKRQKKAKRMLCAGCREEITNKDPVKCSQKSCSKNYHKRCATMKNPEGKFSCPWHHCFKCGRQTPNHCSICKLAFCQVHFSTNLVNSKGTLICKNHHNALGISNIRMDNLKEELEISEDEDKRSFSPFRSSSPILARMVQAPIEDLIKKKSPYTRRKSTRRSTISENSRSFDVEF